ncbi:GNAT family N-acetyltransferase [Paenibacillus sp. LHD-117]|uniref:GNAT family N-acetyltransferase n=1 Tax=Paenibacillus sp. LHD-117 TaxID=3071412 RepID=UPI0027DFA15A|nr:GNAT family N-acetyltransferase [Paenibacillus sp. LHD-117]MDQ6423318.1 GNAT family N-acetyltransferase [Paenibacillus sp. LHD-117]
METLTITNKRLEEISLNGWPALQTVLYDGWLLRFADGYTKRSNSVSAIYGSEQTELELDEKIRTCERLYAQKGIRTVFKITPFVQPARLDEQLERLGYAKVDHTLVKTAALSDVAGHTYEDISIAEELTDEWLDAIAGLQKLTQEQRESTRKMMAGQPLRKGFAIVSEGGRPVACGIVIVEDGWAGLYDIVTAPEARGRGYGEQLTRGLFHFAKGLGARMGYLLVVRDNEPANRLYDKLGFEPVYDYWYRVSANSAIRT